MRTQRRATSRCDDRKLESLIMFNVRVAFSPSQHLSYHVFRFLLNVFKLSHSVSKRCSPRSSNYLRYLTSFHIFFLAVRKNPITVHYAVYILYYTVFTSIFPIYSIPNSALCRTPYTVSLVVFLLLYTASNHYCSSLLIFFNISSIRAWHCS